MPGPSRVWSDFPFLGAIQAIVVNSPAAGAEWTYTFVNDGILFGVRFQYLISTAGSTRAPVILIKDSSAVVIGGASLGSFAANQTVSVIAHAGASGVAGNTFVDRFPAPVLSGGTIETVTSSIDVGDQYSAIQLFVLEM